MPTLETLRQRHPDIDLARLGDLRALYEGGKKFEHRLGPKPNHGGGNFLPQRPHEPENRYLLRMTEAHYTNYMGPIIDFFAALLFATRPVAIPKDESDQVVIEPPPFYADFRDDADQKGKDVDAIMKCMITDAMVERCSWVLVEQRSDSGPAPQTAAEFEERKLGDCWLTPIEGHHVYDWDSDELGLTWVLIHDHEAKRNGLDGNRNRVTETWRYITRETTTTYAITYDKNDPPTADTEVPRIGAPVPHRFGRVPMICLDLPVGLWLAERIRTPQLTHFRLSNALTWGLSQTCYAMPIFKCETDAEGKRRMPTMGAGYGIIMGATESMEWAAPPNTAFVPISEEKKSMKDEIFRITHQMALGVENNAAAVGRSAESKSEDNAAMRVILVAYSRLVKETLEEIYDIISRARGDKLTWSIEGLDDFASVDIAQLVDVLDKVELAGGIPSKTFNGAMKTRLAEALLPDMDQATKQTVKKEIEAGVEQAEEHARIQASNDLEGSDIDLQVKKKMAKAPALPPKAPVKAKTPKPKGKPNAA